MDALTRVGLTTYIYTLFGVMVTVSGLYLRRASEGWGVGPWGWGGSLGMVVLRRVGPVLDGYLVGIFIHSSTGVRAPDRVREAIATSDRPCKQPARYNIVYTP